MEAVAGAQISHRREIFHVSHALTFKRTAPALQWAGAAAVKIFISEICLGQRHTTEPERPTNQTKSN